MKRILTILLLLMVGTAFLGAQEAPGPAAKARIFAINLFALPMDVQWGDDAAYSSAGLQARTAGKGALVDPGVPGTILFRRAGQTSWSSIRGPDGKPLAVALDPGATYTLFVKPNGNGDLVKVGTSGTADPKVLLVNAARGPASILRLGVSADGQAPGWSSFLDGVPGPQTLTWAWQDMPLGTDRYQATSSQPGQPGLTNLAAGHWYVGIVSGVNGKVFDVTP